MESDPSIIEGKGGKKKFLQGREVQSINQQPSRLGS